jgi:zinc protease
LPKPAVFTLANGLTVYLVERHELPLVSAAFVELAGSAENPEDRPGLAGMAAAMLTEGTQNRSAEGIADAAALLGSELESGSDSDSARLGISVLSNNIRPGLDLVADSVEHPSFPSPDLERVRAERLTALIQQQDNPVRLGLRAGILNLFGAGSPYGYDAFGTAASLHAITREQIAAFHSSYFGPRNSLLELTGDVTPAQARKLAEEAFGGWTAPALQAAVPLAPAAPERKILLVDKPGSPQTALLAFGVGLDRKSPDYPAVRVMNTMLGGLFSSRINMNLREEHGYTYGAFSFFRYYRGIGPFIAQTQVRQDATAPAAEQLFKELDGIRTRPLTDTELSMAKDFIIRSLPGDFESARGVNGQLADLWLFDLPLDYYTRLPVQIEGVTSADAQAAAAKYVRPENLLLIAVGDKAKIEAGLKDLKLGAVEAWSEPTQPRPTPGSK